MDIAAAEKQIPVQIVTNTAGEQVVPTKEGIPPMAKNRRVDFLCAEVKKAHKDYRRTPIPATSAPVPVVKNIVVDHPELGCLNFDDDDSSSFDMVGWQHTGEIIENHFESEATEDELQHEAHAMDVSKIALPEKTKVVQDEPAPETAKTVAQIPTFNVQATLKQALSTFQSVADTQLEKDSTNLRSCLLAATPISQPEEPIVDNELENFECLQMETTQSIENELAPNKKFLEQTYKFIKENTGGEDLDEISTPVILTDAHESKTSENVVKQDIPTATKIQPSEMEAELSKINVATTTPVINKSKESERLTEAREITPEEFLDDMDSSTVDAESEIPASEIVVADTEEEIPKMDEEIDEQAESMQMANEDDTLSDTTVEAEVPGCMDENEKDNQMEADNNPVESTNSVTKAGPIFVLDPSEEADELDQVETTPQNNGTSTDNVDTADRKEAIQPESILENKEEEDAKFEEFLDDNVSPLDQPVNSNPPSLTAQVDDLFLPEEPLLPEDPNSNIDFQDTTHLSLPTTAPLTPARERKRSLLTSPCNENFVETVETVEEEVLEEEVLDLLEEGTDDSNTIEKKEKASNESTSNTDEVEEQETLEEETCETTMQTEGRGSYLSNDIHEVEDDLASEVISEQTEGALDIQEDAGGQPEHVEISPKKLVENTESVTNEQVELLDTITEDDIDLQQAESEPTPLKKNEKPEFVGIESPRRSLRVALRLSIEPPDHPKAGTTKVKRKRKRRRSSIAGIRKRAKFEKVERRPKVPKKKKMENEDSNEIDLRKVKLKKLMKKSLVELRHLAKPYMSVVGTKKEKLAEQLLRAKELASKTVSELRTLCQQKKLKADGLQKTQLIRNLFIRKKKIVRRKVVRKRVPRRKQKSVVKRAQKKRRTKRKN